MKNWKESFDNEFRERYFCCASDYCEGDCDSYTREKLKTFIESLLAEQKKELMEEYKDKIQKYKSYYNPVGDELNKGKHIACDDLLESLNHHE